MMFRQTKLSKGAESEKQYELEKRKHSILM